MIKVIQLRRERPSIVAPPEPPEQALEQIRAELSQILGRPGWETADVRELVFRLGKVEDAMAGLKVARHGILNRMITFVCFAIGSRPSELLSFRRARSLAWGRFAIMWAAKELTTLSYVQIGRGLGGFDHTSIIHGCRRAAALRESDKGFRALSDALFAHFESELSPANPEEEVKCLPL